MEARLSGEFGCDRVALRLSVRPSAFHQLTTPVPLRAKRSSDQPQQQHLRNLNTPPNTDACVDRYATMFGAELGLGVNNIKTPNDERLGLLKVCVGLGLVMRGRDA